MLWLVFLFQDGWISIEIFFHSYVLFVLEVTCQLWYFINWVLWHEAFSQLWVSVKILITVGFINVSICFVASTSWSSSGINLKSLMNFYFSSFHKNVSPHSSSILYHFFGKSSNFGGNRCDHIFLSIYPNIFHSFSHVMMCFLESCPCVKTIICDWFLASFL